MVLVSSWRQFRVNFACSFLVEVFSDNRAHNQGINIKMRTNFSSFITVRQPDNRPPGHITLTTTESPQLIPNEMDESITAKKTPDTSVGKPIYLAAEKTPGTTVNTSVPHKSSRERGSLQDPPPEYFTPIPGGARDEGISQERSESLANFYNEIIETVRSTTHAAVLEATQNIAKSTSEEEAARHGKVISDAIEATACNAARRGVSEAIQEHPICEVCKRFYYEGRGPKHPQHDPQDRLFKCINWPCKKWYHVGCLNIKYEMKETYMCMGRFAPCVKTVRKHIQQRVVEEEPGTHQIQRPSITLTVPTNSPAQTHTTIPGQHAVPAQRTVPVYRPILAQPTTPAQPPYHQYSRSTLVPARIAATKGFKKCRGDGKCAKFTHEGNLPAKCDFADCSLKQLCSHCKNNNEDPKGAVHEDKWFCTDYCCKQYLAQVGGDEMAVKEEGADMEMGEGV